MRMIWQLPALTVRNARYIFVGLRAGAQHHRVPLENMLTKRRCGVFVPELLNFLLRRTRSRLLHIAVPVGFLNSQLAAPARRAPDFAGATAAERQVRLRHEVELIQEIERVRIAFGDQIHAGVPCARVDCQAFFPSVRNPRTVAFHICRTHSRLFKRKNPQAGTLRVT